jgi:hypothetical protein
LSVRSLVEVVESLDKYVRAFAVTGECAYSACREMIPEPGEERLDVTMVDRLLNHVEEMAGFVASDVERTREHADVISAYLAAGWNGESK